MKLNPVDRITRGLPGPVRVIVDWAVTIVGAVLIVVALKLWLVNPYRIPSSSMEPTLHCARPGPGCESHYSDRVLADRISFRFTKPKRLAFTRFPSSVSITRPRVTMRPSKASPSMGQASATSRSRAWA